MIKLTFVTSNEGKWQEAQDVLSPYGFEVQPITYDFAEPTAGTIEQIAIQKLQQIRNQGYRRVFVEDSGIFFAAYHQFPGVLSKRVFQGIGYRGLEKLLHNESKDAWFSGTVALDWDGEIKTFSASIDGTIVKKKPSLAPEPGLPFDPIFVPTGEERVFAALSLEKRRQYSYRRRALINMANWIHEQKLDL